MTESLTISQLAERCRLEYERYQQHGQSDETYCFELFRQALIEQNEAAWQAIYDQYQALVARWVHDYSRFSQTTEAADVFVNDAFARLWRYGANPDKARQLDTLGKCLGYLKRCIWSAIEDYLRQQAKDALRQGLPLETSDRPTPNIEGRIQQQLYLDEINTLLWNTVQDEAERLVAQESWVYGLAPRQIQADHSDIFPTTQVVNQTKRNLLKRLRRRLSNKQ